MYESHQLPDVSAILTAVEWPMPRNMPSWLLSKREAVPSLRSIVWHLHRTIGERLHVVHGWFCVQYGNEQVHEYLSQWKLLQ